MGQGRKNVISFIIFFGDGHNTHSGKGLLQQGNLPDEFGGSLTPCRLVLRIYPGSEREARNVEGDSDVGGVFLLQKSQEHRDETVDSVGVLAIW